MTQASTNGITYFRRKSDSLALAPVEVLDFSAAAACSISASSRFACSGVRDRRSAVCAASRLPRRNSHRGDSATIRLPITNKMPSGSADLRDLFDANTEKHANHGCHHDAKRQEPLENACALAPARCRQALREVQRHDDTDQAGADALQESAQHKSLIALRKSDH